MAKIVLNEFADVFMVRALVVLEHVIHLIVGRFFFDTQRKRDARGVSEAGTRHVFRAFFALISSDMESLNAALPVQ